jgi:hypothetical protein
MGQAGHDATSGQQAPWWSRSGIRSTQQIGREAKSMVQKPVLVKARSGARLAAIFGQLDRARSRKVFNHVASDGAWRRRSTARGATKRGLCGRDRRDLARERDVDALP